MGSRGGGRDVRTVRPVTVSVAGGGSAEDCPTVLSRRRALTLGAGSLLGGALLTASGPVRPGEPHTAGADERTGDGPTPAQPGGPPVAVGVQRRYSAARGQDVALAVMLPTGVPADGIPVCLVLHGRGGSAVGMVGLGLPGFLAGALRAGGPPFALVAVDGGDSYWIARGAADDPQAMLRDELPAWLPPFGLAATPHAVIGVSMGGFGALVYGRGRPADPPAVAVLSPALYASWADARVRDAFADEAAWAAAEPLRQPSGLSRLGVWCGQGDPWISAARQLAATERAALARFEPGGHDEDYWRRIMPDVLTFLAPPSA